MKYVLIFVGVLTVFLVGYAVGATVNSIIKVGLERSAMSYGYYEKDNVWNRIRVDDSGRVLCTKEN